jgi:hypothetical protein
MSEVGPTGDSFEEIDPLLATRRVMVSDDGQKRDTSLIQSAELIDTFEYRINSRIRIVKEITGVDDSVDAAFDGRVDDLCECCLKVRSSLGEMILMIAEMCIRGMDNDRHVLVQCLD